MILYIKSKKRSILSAISTIAIAIGRALVMEFRDVYIHTRIHHTRCVIQPSPVSLRMPAKKPIIRVHRQHVVSRRARSWFLAYPGYQVLVCRRWNNQFKLAEWNTARYTRAAREREREVHNEGRADTRTIDRRAERCRRGSIWRREIYPPLPRPQIGIRGSDPLEFIGKYNVLCVSRGQPR